MSLGPLTFMVIAEILPDIGISIAVLVLWLGALIVGFFFPIVSDPSVIGPGGTFLIFTFFAFFGAIFIAKFTPETAGKTKAEIDEFFDKSPKG